MCFKLSRCTEQALTTSPLLILQLSAPRVPSNPMPGNGKISLSIKLMRTHHETAFQQKFVDWTQHQQNYSFLPWLYIFMKYLLPFWAQRTELWTLGPPDNPLLGRCLNRQSESLPSAAKLAWAQPASHASASLGCLALPPLTQVRNLSSPAHRRQSSTDISNSVYFQKEIPLVIFSLPLNNNPNIFVASLVFHEMKSQCSLPVFRLRGWSQPLGYPKQTHSKTSVVWFYIIILL